MHCLTRLPQVGTLPRRRSVRRKQNPKGSTSGNGHRIGPYGICALCDTCAEPECCVRFDVCPGVPDPNPMPRLTLRRSKR